MAALARGRQPVPEIPDDDPGWLRHLLQWQRAALWRISSGTPLPETLAALCTFGEEHLPGRLFSVLLLDPQGTRLLHGAGPSLPQAYNDAIHGLAIGPGVGSCGTAAHERRQVVVEDIATDPRWEAFLPLARKHRLGACWSTPILGTGGILLGTWAVYLRSPGRPTPRDAQVIEVATELAAIAIEKDRSERELARVRGREQEQQGLLQELFAHFPGGVVMLRGPEMRFVFANPAYLALVGGRDVVGKPIRDAFPELQDSPGMAILDEVMRTGEGRTVQEFHQPVPDKDGRFRDGWFNFAVQPLRGEGGQVEGIIGAVYEVTEQVQARRRAEELLVALRSSEDRLRLAVEATQLATWDYDIGRDRGTWNDRAYALFGLHPGSDVTYAGVVAAVHPDDRATVEALWAAALEGSDAGRYAAEFRVVHPGGAIRWVEARGQVLFEAGRALRFIGTAVDSTARKEAERELRLMNERLQRLDRVKTEFLNMASHELRTPLTPLMLRLQMLARHAPTLGERGRRDLEVVLRSAERLSELVTDVLEVTRLESGRFPLHSEALDVGEVVEEVVQTFEPVAAERGVRLLNRATSPLPARGDRHRLAQVLTNVLDNALKYTPSPGVVTVDASSDGREVTVDVTDSGPGLTEAQRERLFEPFVRVHDTQNSPPGSGLGLYIARTIVEQHGGRMEAHSPGPGKGATFLVRLPAVPADPPGEAR